MRPFPGETWRGVDPPPVRALAGPTRVLLKRSERSKHICVIPAQSASLDYWLWPVL